MIIEHLIAYLAIYFITLNPLLILLIKGRKKYGMSLEWSVMLSLFVCVFWVGAWLEPMAEKYKLMDYIESDFIVGLSFGSLFTGGFRPEMLLYIAMSLICALGLVYFFILSNPRPRNKAYPLTFIVQPILSIVVALTIVTPSPKSNSAYYQLDFSLSESMLQLLQVACPDSQSVSYVAKYKDHSDGSYLDNELYCNSGIDLRLSDDYLAYRAFYPEVLGAYHPATNNRWDLVIGFKGDSYVPLIRFDIDKVPPAGSILGYSVAAKIIMDDINDELILRKPELMNLISLEEAGSDDDWEAIRVM